MFRRLLDAPELAASTSRRCASPCPGAAPCPWELAERVARARPGVRILRGYGMTELFRPISYLGARPRDVARLDRLRRCPASRSESSTTPARIVAAGESGELWIRSHPRRSTRYLAAPEATRDVLATAGSSTGDLATRHADGFVTIVGRKKELILRGGYSVCPAEVEAVSV